VVCDVTIVKQKRRACADFLGVLTISINVLRVCCILTTILRVLVPPDGHLEPETAIAGNTPAATFANQTPRENTAPDARDSPHETALTKKAAALNAAASSKRYSRQATV
jgi:hypothetical protein